MVKGYQFWVGVSLGLVILGGVFGAAYLILEGDDLGTDRTEIGSAVASTVVTAVDAAASESFLAVSDEAALRVITPEDSADDDSSTTSEQTTTTAETTTEKPTTQKAEPSTTSTTAKPTTTKPPTTRQTTTSTTEATTTTEQTTTTTQPTSAPTSGDDDRSYEQRVIELTNSHRRQAGCPDLTNNAKLHAAALVHSTDMSVNNYFSHTGLDGSRPDDRITDQGYRFRGWAENIAFGYRTPESVVDGWMNSSGHRANILNCGLVEIGVGFFDYYWTQNFGIPR